MSPINPHELPHSVEKEERLDPEVQIPTTSQEMVDNTLEVLKGEGEPITERAPFVPFAIVFLSYFVVTLSALAIFTFFLWLFVFRT
jgi:hypothetical protein